MKYFIFVITNVLLLIIFVNGAFQTSVFRETNNDFLEKNVCVSPLSMFQVLGLTTNGAKGVTQDEMVSALEATSLKNLNTINLNILQVIKQFETVELANGVMTTFDPTKMFLKICIKYEAPIEPLNSVNQVNEWCAEKTHGKITEILDELNPNTLMLLLNAVYFKADWQYPFNPARTFTGEFTNPNVKGGNEVQFMAQTQNFNYYEDKSVQVVELPYKNDSMSAIVVLPKEKIDLDTYLKSFDDNVLNTLLTGLTSKSVRLSLPKFEIEFKNKFKDILMRLGMVQAFSAGADFSGIKCSGGIHIDDVIHKTYLKVDEYGSEAAAVTIVDMRKGSGPPADITMNVNRPFIFLLRSTKLPKNNDLLFLAKVANL